MLSTVLTILVIIVVFIVLFKVFKLILRLLLVVVFLFLAWITNPTLEQHQEAVSRKAEKTNASIRLNSVVADDYYIFSLTKLEGDDHVIGAGAFTQVFIFGNPD